MRTSERLLRLKNWVEKELCAGRRMKMPAPDLDVAKIIRGEPKCFLAWQPTRMDTNGEMLIDAYSVCPGIQIMPKSGFIKYVEEKRFDRYNNISRPQEFGQTLIVDMLFSVYEPGIRLPGFVDSAESGRGIDMSLLKEGTEEGLFTLLDWMDECKEKLLALGNIPGTDLIMDNSTATYSMYNDGHYVVDKRPIYYGFVSAEFKCYANTAPNRDIDKHLI